MNSRTSAMGAFALAVLLLLSVPAAAYAEREGEARPEQAQWIESSGAETSFKNFFLNRNIEFKGFYSSDRTYIHVDEHWMLSGAALNLSVSVSDLMQDAALTVYVNDTPVNSEPLPATEQISTLRIPLPLSALKEGGNEIRLEVSGNSMGDEAACVEVADTGRWVLVRGSSYVHLTFREAAPSAMISEYPYPFLRTSESPEMRSTLILLPDEAEAEEAAAALRIAAGLGGMALEERTDLNMAEYSQVGRNELGKYDIIYVGRYDRAPEEIRGALQTSDRTGLSEGSVIFRTPSPYHREKMLMGIVTQRDGEALVQAADLLHNRDLVSQIDSSVFALRSGIDVSMRPSAPADQYTLREIGFGNGISLNGPYRQQATVGIKLASNRLVVPGAKAVIRFKYAQNLDFDRSMVTVYVNGVPTGSKTLDAERAGEDVLEVSIPERLVDSNYVEVRLAFDLLLKSMSCDRLNKETPWAFVEGDSTVYLPTQDERAMLLDNFPWPFVKDGRFNDTVVVVPDRPERRDWDFAADLFGYLGREVKDTTGSLAVVADSDLTEWDERHHYILIGTPGQSQAIRKANDVLWFKYDERFDYFLSNEKRRLLENFSRELASVQLVPSPGNPDRGLLVVTASKQDNLLRAKKFLTEPRFADNLIGNALLVDRWGKETSHYFAEDDEFTLVERVRFAGSQLKSFVVVFGTMLLLLVMGAVWYRRGRRRR
ncbi:cellulose biosynthesis cyclic di-GMP-binding regulatory protein BcsB [Paenibacillaceae bacterium WGS1546]|uniref:cellulose biosynthesis cyclic di-GMP-binding regulatory protein BcsB n=1 Tax=Cohnella sp. WGS1546 TaxID=3366810 RepID=UPI00372D70A4